MDDYSWTPEQQAVVDRIVSGQEDYTFGPGSPDATKEDMGTYVGGPHSPAGGFAVHGGVALAPKEYNLFTPQQRRYLGIMDIGPDSNEGKIERYYGGVPAPVSGGQFAMGTSGAPGTNAGAMGMYDPSVAYGGSAPSQTTQGVMAGLAGLSKVLQAFGKSQSQNQPNPLAMMQQHKLAAYAPTQFPQLPYT